MQIHESAEDYLEAILILSKQKPNVRSIDIVNQMGFSKPSVSNAMKKLRENGYITTDDLGYIRLTASGESVAEDILERHNVLTDFLVKIGVDEKTAKEDACRVEHDLSRESFDKIKKHYEALYIKKTV